MLIGQTSLMLFRFLKFFHSKLFLLSSYYILFCDKWLIISIELWNIIILLILLHQATTTVKQGAWQNFPNLIHIDRTTTFTPLAYLFKASPFECFAHTFECQRLMGIDA